MISNNDLEYLARCLELAQEALDKGDEPFGSVLVDESGSLLFEDYNHVAGGDYTQHPEFAIARWAAQNMTPEQREKATVYTSGEHCPMCAAAHGWVGLGRIVYASSSQQLAEWNKEMGKPESPVFNLAITDIIRNAVVDGPIPELAVKVKDMHIEMNRRQNNG